jgi:hypothetical protein
MRKIAALCAASLFLLSCVGIDSTMTIKDNGSGTLVLAYRVSQLVTHLGESTTGESPVPLPVSRADFERSIASAQGKVRLTRFEKSENEKDITIKAELSFDSLTALAQLDSFKDAKLTLTQNGSRRTLSQTIATAAKQPLTADSKAMLDELFEGYVLNFTIQVPNAILAAPIGTLSQDKKTLSYTASAKDVVGASNDIILSLTW